MCTNCNCSTVDVQATPQASDQTIVATYNVAVSARRTAGDGVRQGARVATSSPRWLESLQGSPWGQDDSLP